MIRGQRSIASAPESVSVQINAKLHNRFDFEVVDSVTGEVKQKAYAENIILDKWWTRVFTPGAANGYIHVGTGTGALSASRTTLFTFLAAKASNVSVNTFNEAENWVSHKRVAQWLENETMNTAWTEVGIAHGTSSSQLTTHALIKDLNGNPVTLNKGTTDIVNVYSTVYAYLPASTSTLKFIIPRNGQNLDGDTFIGWLLGLSGYFPLHRTFALKGDVLANSSGYSGSWTGALNMSYNPSGTQTTRTGSAATKKLTMTMARLPAASFNAVQGVKAIAAGVVSYGTGEPTSMNMEMDLQVNVPAPWFPYSTVTAETIAIGDGSTLDFKTYYPFIMNDGSFVLKKNGAIVDPADYTVDYGEPNGSELLYHLKVLDYYRSYHALGVINSPPSDAAAMAAFFITFENPLYAKFGINTITTTYCSIRVSNDSPTGPWTTIPTGAVAAQYQNYRYWKVQPTSTYWQNSWGVSSAVSTTLTNAKNIHFAAGKAPATGDVITADYHCEVIAKNENNVFDLIVEITLQEKVS